jgi:tRNA dimethylallyltransferase
LQDRIERMIEAGAEEEARRAWQRCPDPAAPAWSGIGCAEMLAALHNRLDWSEAKQRWFRRTRQYAKRQLTWFRKDTEIRWLHAEKAADVLRLVGDWLEES